MIDLPEHLRPKKSYKTFEELERHFFKALDYMISNGSYEESEYARKAKLGFPKLIEVLKDSYQQWKDINPYLKEEDFINQILSSSLHMFQASQYLNDELENKMLKEFSGSIQNRESSLKYIKEEFILPLIEKKNYKRFDQFLSDFEISYKKLCDKGTKQDKIFAEQAKYSVEELKKHLEEINALDPYRNIDLIFLQEILPSWKYFLPPNFFPHDLN